VDCLNFFVKHVSAISRRRASPANLIADKESIWFGVIIVMTVELGLIHPPVGMNVFVIKSVVQEVTFSTIFRGVMPFIATDSYSSDYLDLFSDPGSVAPFTHVSSRESGVTRG
jgi:Tripartite ATP-independent periplasmic transporter, DctM component